ncbi:unnamed protein product [Parnassius mnemosyne]|uniref:CCHC-type domain-containing protein n=1 Tax=Parnassius mnemosyne TaxID=213953 RepID=A0AAV1LTX8_9NEOP
MEHARPPSELQLEGGPVSRADAWKRWRQQFVLFMKASGVHSETSAVKASLLINLIGSEGFDIYQTFTFTKEDDRDDVQIILSKFDEYFGTKINITLLRYKFFTRNQEEGENIQQYVTSLRLLSKNCKFATLEEELIKDRIVCGVNSTIVRDRLLRCEDLDLDKAVKLCQVEEISQESSRQLSASGAGVYASVVQVDSVKQGRGRRDAQHTGAGSTSRGTALQALRCPRCGVERCATPRCPAVYATCFTCGKQGHFARVCRQNLNNKAGVKHVYDIEQNQDVTRSFDCESFFISTISGQEDCSDGWFETLIFEKGIENFKLDTGADINVISFERFL